MSGVLALGLGLIGLGYLIIHFVVLVLEDLDNDHEAAQGPAYDAQTLAWLRRLNQPDSEFDEWCEQAIALTRPPEYGDLKLWERELQDGAS